MFALEGFMIGILGSLHCVGMCGPLAMALPVSQKSAWAKIAGALLYNIGRATTYAAMGLVLGLLGVGAKLYGLQQWTSIGLGVLMILSVLFGSIFNMKAWVQKISFKNAGFIQRGISKRLKDPKPSTLFIIGILNGLLPCGLVYIAISGALVSPSLTDSVLFMFLFGLGTLPMMFSIVYFSNLIKGHVLKRIQKLIPIFIIVLGLLFIVRGLNLGIPYLSPKFNPEKQEMKCCH
ncbi:MAG: sulfite exporter TauE/SafE family protein [Prolixibacteraceae bacterium]